MVLEFEVVNRIITCQTENAYLVQHNINNDAVKVVFDEEWNNQDAYVAAFRNGPKVVLTEFQYTIGEPSVLTIPWEALDKPGYLFVSFSSYVGDQKRLTTKNMDSPIPIRPSGDHQGDQSVIPTPDVVKVVLVNCKEATERAIEAAGFFPSGGLKGQILSKKSDLDHDTEWIDNQQSSVKWGNIEGDISDQEDLAEAFSEAYNDINNKVDKSTVGVSSALNNLDFNSHELNDDTQFLVQATAVTWVRRKLYLVAEYVKSKLIGLFVSVDPQFLTHEQRVQVRENIKAAAGGDRYLPQTVGPEDVVIITGYTSYEDSYVLPSDGYLQIRKTGSGLASLHVDNYTLSTSANGGTATIMAAQGFHVWVEGSPTAATFIPWKVKQTN